jgi:hypothetical protein
MTQLGHTKALYRELPVERLFSETTAGIKPAVRQKTLTVDTVKSLKHTSDLPEFLGKSLVFRGDDGI